VFHRLPIFVWQHHQILALNPRKAGSESVESALADLLDIALRDVDVVGFGPGADMRHRHRGNLTHAPVGKVELLVEPLDTVAIDPRGSVIDAWVEDRGEHVLVGSPHSDSSLTDPCEPHGVV